MSSNDLYYTNFLEWLRGPDGGSSTDRPHHVIDWCCDLSDDDGPLFWNVVIAAWSGFDMIPHEMFAEEFERFADSRPPCDVPDRMTVYRGQHADAPKGLSWTRSRDVAEFFARGYRGSTNPKPKVFEMEVTRDQVAFTCDDRQEQEIVLLSIPN